MKNGMIERECLLFEAGDYPDRNLTISHADLIDIATNSPAALPVRVEHLPESPFDGALGTVVDLRADGGRLWGVLRQTEAAWDFVRQSGARALSIALDTAKQALTEVSFVTRPRVASAQVFSGMDSSIVHFDIDWKELDDMQGVKQFAEGIIQHIRSMAGGESGTLELERAHLEAEREALHRESATRKMEHFRQLGLVRPTDAAVGLAAAILGSGDGMIVTFGEARTSVAKLFAEWCVSAESRPLRTRSRISALPSPSVSLRKSRSGTWATKTPPL